MTKNIHDYESAAVYLKSSVPVIKRLVKANLIPAKKHGAKVLIEEPDLDRYFDGLPPHGS